MTAQASLGEIRRMSQPWDNGDPLPLNVEQVKEIHLIAGEALSQLSQEQDQLSHQWDNLFAQVRAALENAPAKCPYHGTDFFFLGAQWGEPRCDSCKQPFRVTRALAALRSAPTPSGGTAQPGGTQ